MDSIQITLHGVSTVEPLLTDTSCKEPASHKQTPNCGAGNFSTNLYIFNLQVKAWIRRPWLPHPIPYGVLFVQTVLSRHLLKADSYAWSQGWLLTGGLTVRIWYLIHILKFISMSWAYGTTKKNSWSPGWWETNPWLHTAVRCSTTEPLGELCGKRSYAK